MTTIEAPNRLAVVAMAGLSAVLGGALWIAAVGWYTQQPFGEDGLRQGWDAFNRMVTLIPLLFALPLYSMRIDPATALAPQRTPRSLIAVIICISIAAVSRLLVDVSVLPPPFAFVGIALFSLSFLWYLIETLRAGTFSRVAVGALLAATCLMLAFIGTETNLVWFAAPFGFVWIWIGVLLFAQRR